MAVEVERDWSNEKLILTVKSFPIIYDSDKKDYANKHTRNETWTKVCEQIVHNWTSLTEKQKRITHCEVRRKWTNLRTAFRRNLVRLKEEKRVPKYVYYENMSFLVKHMKELEQPDFPLDDDENDGDGGGGGGGVDDGDGGTDGVYDDDDSAPKRPSSSYKRKLFESKFEKSVLDIFKENLKEDADKSFLMSFLPVFKQLDQDEKLDLRIQMLQMVRNFTKTRQSANMQISSSDHHSVHHAPVYHAPLVKSDQQHSGDQPKRAKFVSIPYPTSSGGPILITFNSEDASSPTSSHDSDNNNEFEEN